MLFEKWSELKEREIIEGFHGRFIHTESMTLAHWRIEKGAALTAHEHHQEQISQVIEGQFELTIEGKTSVLQSGDIAVIPSGVEHSGKALTECELLDVFSPARDDYREMA